MKIQTIEELEKEIEKAQTENCLDYDHHPKDKRKPMFCKLCGNYYTRMGIDRHLNHAHGIVRFDWGIRNAKLQTRKEDLEVIENHFNNLAGCTCFTDDFGVVHMCHLCKFKQILKGERK